jgi:hypothetical protein
MIIKSILKYLKPSNFNQFYIEICMIYNLFLITFFASFIKGYILLFLVYFFPVILILFFFFLKLLFLKNEIKFHPSFFYSLLIFFLLIIVGLFENNFIADILTNALFFISPLLSFYIISSCINDDRDKLWLIKNFIVLTSLQILTFFTIKFFNFTVLNKDLVNYEAFNVGGLQSSFLVVSYFLYTRKKYYNNYGNYFVIFVTFLLINELLVPIVLPFKQLLLLLFLFLSYIFVFILPKKYLFLIFLIVFFITTINLEKIYVFTRLFSHFSELSSNSIFLDKRIIEVYGVVNTIKANLPFSIIYGKGFGGLWDSNTIGIDISYLKQVDFRKNTNVSMVHSSFFTLFMRGGFLSLSCYIILFYIVYYKNKIAFTMFSQNSDYYYYFKSFKFYFLILILASFFDWYIYANSFIGLLFAISTLKPITKHI